MKKIIALILCAILVTATACGPRAASNNDDNDETVMSATYVKPNGGIETVTITEAVQTGSLESVTLKTDSGDTIIVGIDNLLIKRSPVHIPNPVQRQEYIDRQGLQVTIKQPNGWLTSMAGVCINNSNSIITETESVRVADMCRIDAIDAEYFVSPHNLIATSE